MSDDLQRPVLAIEGLSVRLPRGSDRAFAVKDVTLAVMPRETLCIVGESGSGKSVIAQSIMGLLPRPLTHAGGSIRLDDESIVDASSRRLRSLRGSRMAMIFQEPMTALNPMMTIGRQIEEVLQVHTDLSSAEREAQVLSAIADVNLPDAALLYHAYPHELSGGQRQRAMIAAALVLAPAVLIADEPTTALDVTTQAQILKLLKDIQRRHGTAIVFITHDIGVVADIADRVAVMRQGELLEEGATRTVLTEPRHPYTRMLIGSVPGLTPRRVETQAAQEIAISIDNLGKTYRPTSLFGAKRTVDALKQVSFDIRRGETFGIVGESGSGKSTLARCIVRLVDPSAGEIRLGAAELAHAAGEQLRCERRRVQIVFQDPYRSLNPRRTVGQTIVECPMNYSVPAAAAWKRAAELMRLVGLEPAALSRYPHEFSGGQRQRISIARALAVEPELLIADEAVSALDVSVQAQVLALLDDIRKCLNLAILFITHDLRVAAQVCDRVAVMHRGSIVESGLTETVFSSPQHPYTRTLLDAAPGKGWTFGTHGAVQGPV